MKRTLRQVVTGACGVSALVMAALVPGLVSGEPPAAAPVERTLRSIDDVEAVASYTLRAKLDPGAHTVEGEGTISFVNASDTPLDHVWVHLYMNAFEDEGTIFRRQRASGMRGSDAIPDPGSIEVQRFAYEGANVWPKDAHTAGDDRDRTDIKVALPRPIAPHATATFEIQFRTKLPSIALRTGYLDRFHMVAQWFPKIAKLEPDGTFAHFPFSRYSEFYSNFGDYHVTVDVPEAFEVGASGTLEREEKERGRRILEFRERAVGDFAFAAWDGFAEMKRTAGLVELRCLYPRGQERAANKELESAARGLEFYGREFGPYPYRHLTIVHPPDGADEAGGMEYPTLITTGGSAWAALAPALWLEGLVLHELAHQWFYGIVATNENGYPFLDEGLTSYATGRALTALYGEDGLVSVAPFSVDLAEIERAAQLDAYDRAPVASGAAAFPSGADYAELVYARTATILRTFDRAYDGAAARAVSAYAMKYRFAHPGPKDLLRTFEAETSPEAADILDALLFSEGHLDFQPTAIENEKHADGTYIRRITVLRHGDVELPVEIEIVSDDGSRQRVRWDGRAESTVLSSTAPSPAVAVLVDPDHRVLLDESRLDDALSLRPSRAAPRMFVLSAFASSLLMHAVSP